MRRSRERNPPVRARSAAAGRLRWTEAAHVYREAVRGAGARRRRRMAARSRLERRRATRRFRRRRPEQARRASGRRGDGPVTGYYDMAGLSATLRGAGAPWSAAAARRRLRPRAPAGAVGGQRVDVRPSLRALAVRALDVDADRCSGPPNDPRACKGSPYGGETCPYSDLSRLYLTSRYVTPRLKPHQTTPFRVSRTRTGPDRATHVTFPPPHG